MRQLSRIFNNNRSGKMSNLIMHHIRCKHSTTNTTPQQISNSTFGVQYCINLVQQNDYENYLCTLLLDSEKRRHAFALRAFNVEVAKCGSKVSEEHIGKMRLKFWHDSIDKCFGKEKSFVEDHPVLRELKNTIETHKLTKLYLKRLVTSRDRPPNQQFLTVKDMEDYSEQSVSSLLYLLIELWGVKDMQVDHAVSHLGKALGIATLLRAIPYKGRSEALNIPQAILLKHGVSQERVLRDSPGDKGVENCVFEVATASHQHFEQARNLFEKVPKNLRKVFLPAVVVKRYLERLRRANFRLTHQSCLRRDSMLPIALYLSSLRGRF